MSSDDEDLVKADDDDRKYKFAAGAMFIKAIRSSGYKNAAMALGELIDNSLQAGSHNVDLLISERSSLVKSRRMWNHHEIAVLDDGCGMDAELLRRSLKMGDGDGTPLIVGGFIINSLDEMRSPLHGPVHT